MANPPSRSNVKLLCHFDGEHGASVYTDSSINNRTVNEVGPGVTTDTSVKKYGTASLNLRDAGSIDRLYCDDHADWHFGAGQFTVECWAYWTTAPGSNVEGLVAQFGGSTNLGWFFGMAGGSLAFYYSTTGTDNPNVGAAFTPTLNTWYHVAVDRDASNVLRVYLNGAVHASATVASTFFDSSRTLTIGNDENATRKTKGFLDDVRVVKGEAVYGGAFTPPTAALPDNVARVSQLPVEVLRTNLAAKVRTSQVAVEVLRINTGTKIRASQLAVEVLRPNVAVASATARPFVFVAT